MARILLVRHAPTPETGTRLTGRAGGVSLGPDGEKLARSTARLLADLKIQAVYCSPIERTLETAQIVAEPHGLAPIIDEGLIEMDFGSWTGRTLKDLSRTKLWQAIQHTPSRTQMPNGETFTGAQARAVQTVEAIATRTGKATAVAVSHSDIIKLVLSHYLGQPLDLFQRLHISPGSVSELILNGTRPPMVVAVNRLGADSNE